MAHDGISTGHVLVFVLWRLLIFRCLEQTSDAKGKHMRNEIKQRFKKRTVFPDLE